MISSSYSVGNRGGGKIVSLPFFDLKLDTKKNTKAVKRLKPDSNSGKHSRTNGKVLQLQGEAAMSKDQNQRQRLDCIISSPDSSTADNPNADTATIPLLERLKLDTNEPIWEPRSPTDSNESEVANNDDFVPKSLSAQSALCNNIVPYNLKFNTICNTTVYSAPVSTETSPVKEHESNQMLAKADEKKRENERIILNVSGSRFITKRKYLDEVPGSLLSDLDSCEEYYDAENKEYFFPRNAVIFHNILDLYHCGELHFCYQCCASKLKAELDFWKIEDSCISNCCITEYIKRRDEEKDQEEMSKDFQLDSELHEPEIVTIPHKIWLILNVPTSSLLAMIWATIYLVVTMISLCLQTFRSVNGIRTPLGGYDEYNLPISNSSKLFNITNATTADYHLEDDMEYDDWLAGLPPEIRKNPKLIMYINTIEPQFFIPLEKACEIFFIIDIAGRFIFSPSKPRFFVNFINVVDLLAICAFWTNEFLASLNVITPNNVHKMLPLLLLMNAMSLFRVLHIFKLASKYSPIRVMYLALFSSWRELLLLIILIFIGMSTFGYLIYIVEFSEETFHDIPTGFYWAIITMTTVGYGDVSPKSPIGCVLAIICAITGVLLMALPIPVVANKFMDYYNYAHLQRKKEIDIDHVASPEIPLNIVPKVHRKKRRFLSRKKAKHEHLLPGESVL